MEAHGGNVEPEGWSSMDLFISFHSGRLHTKLLLSQIFPSISLPLFFPPSSACVSPFPVSLSLSSAVYFSKFLKGEIRMRRFVLCLWSCATSAQQEEQLKKKFSICSNICFLIQRETLFSADTSFISFFLSDFGLFPQSLLQHKQAEFPSILQWAL